MLWRQTGNDSNDTAIIKRNCVYNKEHTERVTLECIIMLLYIDDERYDERLFIFINLFFIFFHVSTNNRQICSVCTNIAVGGQSEVSLSIFQETSPRRPIYGDFILRTELR